MVVWLLNSGNLPVAITATVVINSGNQPVLLAIVAGAITCYCCWSYYACAVHRVVCL